MKLFLISVALLLSAITDFARADSSALQFNTSPNVQADDVSQQLWTSLKFPGKAILSYPEIDLRDYLDYDHAQCDQVVNQLLSLSEKYRTDLATSSNATQKDLDQIHTYLFNTLVDKSTDKSGLPNPCYQTAMNAYVLESLIIVNDPQYEVAVKNKIQTSSQVSVSNFVPENRSTFLLAVALLNGGHIQILTPELRKSLGGGWIDQIPKPQKFTSPYQLRGAYSCTTSKIYVDTEVTPINLAANIVHEIDHFIRDRRSPAPADGADWKAILLQDETFALATGVFKQLMLTNIQVPRNRFARAFSDGYLGPFYQAYKSVGDGNLFSKDGPLDQVYHTGDSYDFSRNMFGTYSGYPHELNLSCSAPIENVYKAVNAVYFPNSTLTDSAYAAMDQSFSGTSTEGLYKWLADTTPFQPLMIPTSSPPLPFEIDGDFTRMPFNGFNYGRRLQLPVQQALTSIAQLLTGIDAPSPMCQALVTSGDNKDVQDYIGSKLSLGDKNGEAGVKGGEAGVKGGEAGVKGGEAGVKGTAPVRACMILNQNE